MKGDAGTPLTVVETPQFVRQANDVWTDLEREEFVDYIARNPEQGDVIPETGGFARCDGGGEEPAGGAAFG